MTDNNGGIPSTPSWMTDNRQRRSNRRGYGRRYSGLGNGAGGIRSTATKVSRRRDPALFSRPGSALSPDDGGGEGGGGPLDRSANARLEGRRGLPPRPTSGVGNVDVLDQSAHARLESRPAATGDGLDLTDEFEGTSQPRKKRPHLPRPPRAGPRAAAGRKNKASAPRAGPRVAAGRKNKASAPGAKSDAFVFEQDAVEMVNGNSNSSHGSGAEVTEGSRDHPIPLLKDNVVASGGGGGGAEAGGDAKRSKIAYRRSNSATAAAASKSLSLFEENVHPNDTSPDAGKLGANVGTRRSLRLRKARRASVAGGSSSPNDNNDSTFVTTRSRARANSKKRSAAASVTSQSTNARTGSARPEQVQQRSPPNLRTASAASLSSVGSFSSSAGSCVGSETFSSLAQQCSDKSWASGSETAASAKSFAKSKNNSSSGCGGSATALKTPSSNDSLHHRFVSSGDDPPSAGSGVTLGAESFLSPGEGGTIPTPSAGSASSRKRSCADVTGPSPPDRDGEGPGGSQRVSRSRKGPPPRSSTNGATGGDDGLGGSERIPRTRRGPLQFRTGRAAGEDDGLGGSERFPRTRKGPPPQFAADQGIVASTTLPDGGPTTTGVFSPPSKSSFVNALTSEMSFFGRNDDVADDKNNGVRDRLSSNDDSMMSTESAGEDSGCRSSEDEDEDEGDDDAGDTPREMTDAEVFKAKPSQDDFKFLVRSLQKWSQTSHGRGASMGLNGGCLIAVPPGWTFEHRAHFARWATMAFGFRAGSVGGASGGTFLRCCDLEGREALARLGRISNDLKAGRLALQKGVGGGINEVAAGKKKSEKPLHGREKPKAKLPIKLSSTQRSSAISKKEPPKLSMSPICDSFVGDLLADGMKGVTLDETEPVKGNTPGSNCSAPHFIRSMTLQPLANKVKPKALPCFRNNSPTMESNGRRSGGGGGGGLRPPRLSAESAIHASDLLNQLHAGCGNSPSPRPNRLLGRLRDRSARALQPAAARRPSLEKVSFRSSFDRPTGGQHQGCLKSFESPHPRTSLALETPSARLEVGLETPLPKQVEHWGSRPVFGKDWGESAWCCDSTTDACSQVFAKSWFTSDYYGNEDLSAQYQMSLEAEDESYLFAFYEADANTDHDDDDSDFDSEVSSINRDTLDDFPTEWTPRKIGIARCDSVGATAMDLLNLDDNPGFDRRRLMKLRKYARMSLCAAVASDFPHQPKLKRYSRMSEPPRKWSFSKGSFTPVNSIMDSNAFSCVLSFLNEGELIHAASLVCTKWADRAAEALGNLMLVSVGCDPCDLSSDEADETEPVDDQADVSLAFSSVAKSMERDWPYLMHRFPWAKFLSDGSFKRVYKVWNDYCGAYEALSVMDVDAIDDMGNSSLVGTELAVSVLLSSLARRNICPNFVVTRGVFTCPHEPPARLWGCRDDAAPRGDTYAGRKTHTSRAPKPGQRGNFQYIRMELCQHGDIEEFIKSHPEKMLTPWDCRNLLFQMAFALHVASHRFGMKHYDVKLLNFFLQSAKDPTISDEQHPHVVLRYGVGSHVFRLRMHPSSAHIAKLADYGTSVMRADTDGHPVTIGQFTTLENTPPDYLILGNAAQQGYGHDCFGLGLCMLHLFTGHGPYEEILDEVVCPANLKQQLRKVWKQWSHNVIRSVIFDNDEHGKEIEDETLYDTLYRYLVLFGIPKQQFDRKKHGKVWLAINSILLPPKGRRFKKCPDMDAFEKHRRKFSLAKGTDRRIAGARRRLMEMDGAMELLLSLVSFDPKTRATPLDVINSSFMSDLREDDHIFYCKADIVKSYTAYLANNNV